MSRRRGICLQEHVQNAAGDVLGNCRVRPAAASAVVSQLHPQGSRSGCSLVIVSRRECRARSRRERALPHRRFAGGAPRRVRRQHVRASPVRFTGALCAGAGGRPQGAERRPLLVTPGEEGSLRRPTLLTALAAAGPAMLPHRSGRSRSWCLRVSGRIRNRAPDHAPGPAPGARGAHREPGRRTALLAGQHQSPGSRPGFRA